VIDGSPDNAYCWGRGTEGQLGDGSETDGPAPVSVAGGLTFTAISVGGLHTCGLTSGGDSYWWGSNSTGQLGDGTTMDRATPVRVGGGLTFKAISAGGDYPYDIGPMRAEQPRGSFTCALTIDDKAYCWGMGGVLGDGTDQPSSSPVPVAGDHRFVSIDAGYREVCALTTGQAVYCWGDVVWDSTVATSPVRLPEPEFRR
jgi:alpha-tubulin suppressor-like RCC1 family protein